jgi:AcrR family transcriptional regulator
MEAWPMRKGEATRLRILEAAARQAAARGLTTVSLADVADGVGLSKSGLFKHFDSKEAMQLAIIELVCARFIDFVWTAAADEPPGRARLQRAFDRWLEWGEHEWADCGCPVNAFISELDDQPGAVRDLLRERLQAFRDTGIGEMRRVRQPPLTEAEAQAAYFQMRSFVLGHADARRMMGDRDARDPARAAFEAMLDRVSAAA